MFPDSFIDDLKARLSIRDIVGKRVKLQKRGNNLFGLCPFHNEKSPSFSVSEDKGFYHCFGCGAQGDMINFVQNTEGLTFQEAVESLASRAGLEPPALDAASQEREKKRGTLLQCAELAAQWYQQQLLTPAGAQAKAYADNRGLNPDSMKLFRLGYAPDRKGALLQHLKQNQFTEEDALNIGILGRRDDGSTYDYFRDRLIFPIMDGQGRVISFGGRTLSGTEPKYLNGPETPLFNKRAVLYGLPQARTTMRSTNSAIIVEGYMDVIALYQAGITQTVAPLGTALTADHLNLLWRQCDDPVLCFDGDDAGQRAANRAIDVALPLIASGKSLRFITLPQGEDPDSFVQSSGAQAFLSLIPKAASMAERLFQVESSLKPVSTPEQRADLIKRLNKHAALMQDMQLKSFYRDYFNAEISKRFRNTRGIKGKYGTPAASSGRGLMNPQHLQEKYVKGLLAIVLYHPTLAEDLMEHVAALSDLSPTYASFSTYLGDAVMEGIDSGAAIEQFMIARGLKDLINDLKDPTLVTIYPFLKPSTPLETVRDKWHQAFQSVMEKLSPESTTDVPDLTSADEWEKFVKSKQAASSQSSHSNVDEND